MLRNTMAQIPSWETDSISDSLEIPSFYGTEVSLLRLQEPVNCPYSEPDQPSPSPPILHVIVSYHLQLGLFNDLFPSYSPNKKKYAFFLSPYVQHYLPLSPTPLDLITLIMLGA